MIYVGQEPWHGLGVKLDNPPTIKEAIKMAGLDWTVRCEPAHTLIDGKQVPIPGQATIRSTDNSVLGCVGPGYHPIQNQEAFEFFEPFVESKEVSIETAGSLKEGRRIWVLAKINRDPVEIVKDDPILAYFLLANSHDGTLAGRVGFTATRVVCNNTLQMAIGAGGLLKVKHTKNASEALKAIRDTVDMTHREFVANAEQMRAMARFGVTTETLDKYVRRVFKKREETNEEAEQGHDRVLAQVVPLFEGGRGSDVVKVSGTMWNAYNAVTEFLSHERGRDQSTRVDQLFFGEGRRIGLRALTVANDMMQAAA
jgi:phage/plasmid-like protein (TIGR03299 family)